MYQIKLFTYTISFDPYNLGSIINPLLFIGKQRLRKVL